MKRNLFIILAFFILQSATAGPKKGSGNFSNILVSEHVKLYQENPNELILTHKRSHKSVHLILDENYVYLEYKGEIMGQFLKKYEYTIIPEKDKIDIIVKKKNGKFINEYFIIDYENQAHIAEVVQ